MYERSEAQSQPRFAHSCYGKLRLLILNLSLACKYPSFITETLLLSALSITLTLKYRVEGCTPTYTGSSLFRLRHEPNNIPAFVSLSNPDRRLLDIMCFYSLHSNESLKRHEDYIYKPKIHKIKHFLVSGLSADNKPSSREQALHRPV